MIKTMGQAIRVQTSRKAAGLKGRSKAVRRFIKRHYAPSVDIAQKGFSVSERNALQGDFSQCRSFEETYLSARQLRKGGG